MTARITAILLATSYLLLATPVYAQTATSSAAPTTNYQLPTTIPPTSPLYTDLLLNNMFHSFSCLAIGSSVIGQPCLTYQITKNAQGAIQSVPMLSSVNLSGGTLGTVSSLIGALYLNPPVRTADYLASVGQGLGIAKEARAQGVTGSGANVLSPIIKLWQVSRNVSYVIMIIIFVVIGLMVMFRQKINPQTVITAQAALPGLVIGLILITFSYFLAGLISDMAFVGTNVVGYYFSAAQEKPPSTANCPNPSNLVACTEKQNVISIFSRFAGIVSHNDVKQALDAIWDDLSTSVRNLLSMVAVFMLTQFTLEKTAFLKAIPNAGEAIQAVIVGAANVIAYNEKTRIVGWALSLIATLILLYSMFKLLLRLVNNVLNIIFLTVTAPFHFLAASLPGRQSIATNWMLSMLCNVLAFPAVMGVFYFVAFLLGETRGIFPVSTTTSITGTLNFPLFGGMNLDFIRILLAFGALVATPTIPDIICRTFGRASQAGQMIGQGISAGVGAGMGYYARGNQGLNAASALGAKARGFFNTPGYKLDTEGRIIKTYDAGRGATFGAIARGNNLFARGIRKLSGGHIGAVPSQEEPIQEGSKETKKDDSTPVEG